MLANADKLWHPEWQENQLNLPMKAKPLPLIYSRDSAHKCFQPLLKGKAVCLSQTGQYSTQIFSLAVLLSSLFVYNQMGGIDEAALDRLSLVTEMTKHVRVRAGAAAGMASKQFSSASNAYLFEDDI